MRSIGSRFTVNVFAPHAWNWCPSRSWVHHLCWHIDDTWGVSQYLCLSESDGRGVWGHRSHVPPMPGPGQSTQTGQALELQCWPEHCWRCQGPARNHVITGEIASVVLIIDVLIVSTFTFVLTSIGCVASGPWCPSVEPHAAKNQRAAGVRSQNQGDSPAC